ncbi:hypothetical protein BZG36_01644 [Bifiguratus adelaidae]|uniref:Eukaryotic translation initiation factor 4E n=1 Tax=Bifiguratus adelaidae TaxID=1938954 RepID=A0A261Y4F4_9FUNG|nr:hypothetical protein BZG36_01644 [Bifiguratus adelaidae]
MAEQEATNGVAEQVQSAPIESTPFTTTEDGSTKPENTSADTQENGSNANGNDAITTVFQDPVNYNVIHPLQNQWTLWFDNPGKKANAQSWSQNLKELITFNSVEEFWGVYNNVVKVSDLAISSNYHLFKKGVRPEWEDPENTNGGKWVIQFPRGKTGEEINNIWLYTVLACIGEAFPYEDEICGAVVSVRKIFYRISLWTKTCDDREKCEAVGRQLKQALGIPPHLNLEFTPHSDAAVKSAPKEKLVV